MAVCTSQGASRISTAKTAKAFGTKLSVCSWMLVMVCKSATMKPTIRPVSSIGAESRSTRMMPCVRMERTKLWVMAGSLEASDERFDQQVPPARQREDHHLE